MIRPRAPELTIACLHSPLSSARSRAGGAVSLVPLESCSRLSLRIRLIEGKQAGSAGQFQFDRPINSCEALGGTTLARLGPDEWLALHEHPEIASLTGELDAALAGCFYSLVDISHRSVGILVSGHRACDVLNGGCPLDLHDEAFPAGSATRTIFGKAEIVLLRPGIDRAYRVECARSFAPYVFSLLEELAREPLGER